MPASSIYRRILAFLFFNSTIFAEAINFNLSDYQLDNNRQEVRHLSTQPAGQRYFKNFKIPLITKNQTGLKAVPQKIQIISQKSRPVLTGVNYATRHEDSSTVYEDYSNLPVAIASSGFARGNGILNLEFSPFIFSHDTLFFVENLEYRLSDYYLPTLQHDRISEELDLLIITSRSAVESLAKYRRFKEENGVRTQITAVEDICNSTQGSSTAHKIRSYIKECYRHQKIKHVLLAGSVALIPTAIFQNKPGEDKIPSDQFYSNLDSEFDTNLNGVYADQNDQVDFYPDVFLGRWPGSTPSELERIADKTMHYLKGSLSSRENFYSSLLLTAFFLNDNDLGNSNIYCDNMKHITAPGLSAVDSLYQGITPGFSLSTVYSRINLGYNLMYLQAHGNHNKVGIKGGWGIYSDHLYYSQAASGLYFIASCLPGDFNSSGMVIKAMLSPAGGCINYIGTTGEEWPSHTENLHRFTLLNLKNQQQLGEALTQGRISGLTALNTSPVNRQLYFGYSLQGDPSNYFFMNQPIKAGLHNLSTPKKGRGTITGQLNNPLQKPAIITISTEAGILATTVTANNFFSIRYENLFADSAVISISSPEIFFEKVTLATSAADQDLQVQNISVHDANNSGIVENMDNFKIALTISASGQLPADSLQVIFNSPALSLTASETIPCPAAGASNEWQLFDIAPDLSTLQADTSLAFTLRIYPKTAPGTKPLESIFTGNYLLPVANPRLEISWVRYPDSTSVRPVLVNLSAGMINQAMVSLINSNSADSSGKTAIILKNIPGRQILTDSLLFPCSKDGSCQLRIIQTPFKDYLTGSFRRSAETPLMADTLTFHSEYSAKNLQLNWTGFKSNISYNIYAYNSDTLSAVPPVNMKPLNYAFYSYPHTAGSITDQYFKVTLVDNQSLEEFAESAFFKISAIPPYQQAPYMLLPFQLYNPLLVGNRIIANTESGCIVGIPSDGLNFTGNGSIYNSLTHGLQDDYRQGRAVGDINGDSQDDFINLTWCDYDSVYLQAVDLQQGELLAKKSIYGFCKMASPVLANIDNDPQLEILLTLFNGPNHDNAPRGSFLYAFDYQNGSFLIKPGYPIISYRSSFFVGAPIVTDLDNNGSRELLFDCGSYLEVYRLSDLTKITEYNLGNMLSGSLNICDIDGDQKPEIICQTSNSGGIAGKLRVLKFIDNTICDYNSFAGGAGLEMQPFVFEKLTSTPVAADIDLDGTPEIIALTGKKLYVFTAAGQDYANFPLTLPAAIKDNNQNTPSLADLDGDGNLDILFMDGNGLIHAYSGSTAAKLPGFPITIPQLEKLHFGSLNIADLDHDGDLEILCGAKGGQLYIFDYPLQSSNREIYSYYRGDPANSGFFRRTDTVSIPNQDNRPADLAILSQYPNPFNPVTSIIFVVPGAEEVQFKVFNSLGQLVYQEKNFYPKSGLQTIQFNGSSLSSGLYIYSLKYGQQVKIGKCALLK